MYVDDLALFYVNESDIITQTIINKDTMILAYWTKKNNNKYRKKNYKEKQPPHIQA